MPEKLLEATVNALFKEQMYRDILIVFSKNNPGGNPNLLYWYGVSYTRPGVRASAYI